MSTSEDLAIANQARAEAQVHPYVEGFWWGVGAGFAFGLGTALIVFVGAIMVLA